MTPFLSGGLASPIRSCANVPLYVMATGYNIDIAPSGIRFFNVVYIVVLINVVVKKAHRKKIIIHIDY